MVGCLQCLCPFRAHNKDPNLGTISRAVTRANNRGTTTCSSLLDRILVVNQDVGLTCLPQASGHAGIIALANGRLRKKDDEHIEREIYKYLADHPGDPLQPFIAKFFGETGPSKEYIELTNFIHARPRAIVMDVKMGIRTFDRTHKGAVKKGFGDKLATLLGKTRGIEKEESLRQMSDMFPDVSFEDLTKGHYLGTKDKFTTTGKLGFRIDGIIDSQQERVALACSALDDRGMVKSKEDQRQVVRNEIVSTFLPLLPGGQENIDKLLRKLVSSLRALKDACMASPFYSKACFVGMSLLFVLDPDSDEGFVRMIDFGKTTLQTSEVDHGRDGDGVNVGLDELGMIFDRLLLGQRGSRRASCP